MTETVDGKDEQIRALRRSDGHELWTARWTGSLSVPFFAKANGDWIRATPAYDGERLYVAGMRDVLVCLNGEDGTQLWRVTQPFGKYWSMVANRDRILALDEKGELLLIQANPAEFQLLDRRRVSDSPAWAHLAVVDGEFMVRDLDGLTVFRRSSP